MTPAQEYLSKLFGEWCEQHADVVAHAAVSLLPADTEQETKDLLFTEVCFHIANDCNGEIIRDLITPEHQGATREGILSDLCTDLAWVRCDACRRWLSGESEPPAERAFRSAESDPVFHYRDGSWRDCRAICDRCAGVYAPKQITTNHYGSI